MPKLSDNEIHLTRRYLIWCYKTTKEELDKIDRYYTQLEVDKRLLKSLKKTKEYRRKKDEDYIGLVDDFEIYMQKKKDSVDSKKFADIKRKVLDPKYTYMLQRFRAIEMAIIEFFGEDELETICALYEKEMTERILSSREHS